MGKLTRASNDPIYLVDRDPNANACLANARAFPVGGRRVGNA